MPRKMSNPRKAKKTDKGQSTFQLDQEVILELKGAQWAFQRGNDDVYELRLNLATPAAVTAEKANAPAVGLPTLDGFLSYIAFRAAVSEVLKKNPDLAQRVLWQWNVALRDPNAWIDFQIPVQKHILHNYTLYDCSVGLPLPEKWGQPLIPAGSLFTLNGSSFGHYPEVVDSIPLRRRVAEPYGRQIALKSNLVTTQGKTKALDNKLYFPITLGYVFRFRGDSSGVEKLLSFAMDNNIGLGKKTTLGFGQLRSFKVSRREDLSATWTHPVLANRLALIKSIPFDLMFAEKDKGSMQKFLGCQKFALQAVLETFGTYAPPYWLRERRTQVMRYGSLIQPKPTTAP